MRICFIHQNMPGQYRALMPHFAANPDHEVVAIGEADNIRRNFMQVPSGLKLLGYQMPPLDKLVGHPFLTSAENFVYRGERVGRVLTDLKKNGFTPDVVYAHPGWGESLYVKDVFPDTRLINNCEFFYHNKGYDFGFDAEYPETPFSEWGLRTRNAIQLLGLDSMDVGVSPTRWQAESYPLEYQPKISLVHEGVDTTVLQPDPNAVVTIREKGITLTAKDEVITYVSRNLEPYRGFHIFMRALPDLLAERPNAHVMIIGGDEVSYGKKLAQGTYRQHALREVGSKLDRTRVHFLGKVPYKDYLRVLQISTAHIYLTYPFVLSWSMLEAMALGCVVVGSRTPPVEEVITHGQNGLLVDFFSPQEIVEAVVKVCASKDRMQDMRAKARQSIVDKYDYKTICLPKQIELIEGRAGSQATVAKPVPAKAAPVAKAPVEKPLAEKPVAEKAVAVKGATEKPAIEKPAAEKPVAEKGSIKKLSLKKPLTKK